MITISVRDVHIGAEELNHFLNEKHLSPSAVACILQTTTKRVNKWITGRRSIPYAAQLLIYIFSKSSDALGMIYKRTVSPSIIPVRIAREQVADGTKEG